jgi:hypothetical protein
VSDAGGDDSRGTNDVDFLVDGWAKAVDRRGGVDNNGRS